jgi:hypothetical protein
MDEIMDEVESLNRSIEKICPEIISMSSYPSIKEQRDEMNDLIEHRINLLSGSTEKQKQEHTK